MVAVWLCVEKCLGEKCAANRRRRGSSGGRKLAARMRSEMVKRVVVNGFLTIPMPTVEMGLKFGDEVKWDESFSWRVFISTSSLYFLSTRE